VAANVTATITFLVSDIEGSTRLLARLGRERYARTLAEQQRLLREIFAAGGGDEVDTQGDSFLVAFRSAIDAVAAAVDAQRAVARHEWPEGSELRVRIGIHSGEADSSEGRYVGLAVHRAARIGAIASGGQVLVSSATRELIEGDLDGGISLVELGAARLKDFDRPEPIAQVAADGLVRDFPTPSGLVESDRSVVQLSPLVRVRWGSLRRRLRRRA
jgi:class 3 adenylate cyclase